jgi:hypothetical protein
MTSGVYVYAYAGAGAAGTSFSGGAAGGAAMNSLGPDWSSGYGGAGAANGGAGGNGGGVSIYVCGGGAGNPIGANVISDAALEFNSVPAITGTGGLLILTVLGYLYIASGATISSNGSAGGYWVSRNDGSPNEPGGGGSGGGSINILCATYTNNGTLQANGGTGGLGYWAGSYMNGGAGGAGSVRLNSLRTT